MNLKPWREIAHPHKDVLDGNIKQSEFAADITQVATGRAPAEYQDADKFFARTFITEGMRLLLISVAQRLAGMGGDPVVQLQTSFGGGKTHSMLAVWHLAKREMGIDKLKGIPTLLDSAGIYELPSANVAVLDGIALSVSQGKKHGNICANTLWGEMAWQLLGEPGYEMVAASDRDGTAPGKDVIADLLSKAAPCVVLVDELQKFISDLTPGKQLNAGTYEANLKFIQALTEAFKTVPNAILLASLPESNAEVGDSFGQSTLAALEKHFGRVESVWKPVAAEEAFEIVRRRLFESAGDQKAVESVCRQFCDFYKQNSNYFPEETQTNAYYERMCASYPIHPEIFDRLYEDWSTLDKFQRTRGVLQYMAVIIHRLWNENNQDFLIMPGSIPLDDNNVRIKSIHYLPQGWEPVIEREVDGLRSEPHRLDGEQTRFGSVQAAQRSMRTIFLGSAPSSQNQGVKGLLIERILLGSVQPNQTVGVFVDVLKHLQDKLHYLYSDKDRLWLDTKPNLRREMESRKKDVNDIALINELKKQVQIAFGANQFFSGIHIFTNSNDVPDDFGSGPRLVVLRPEHSYSKIDGEDAINAAKEILEYRGDQPRQKRNRLIFFAADKDMVSRLKDAARTYLAWCEIVSDINDSKLNLDLFQAEQAKKNKESTKNGLMHIVAEAYKWILCPSQFDPMEQTIEWEAVSIPTSTSMLGKAIEKKLKEEEWVISEWSPIHLKNLLSRWYFKDGQVEVKVTQVYQDACNYLYFPKLVNGDVYKQTIEDGITSEDFFGYASDEIDGKYLGFHFGAEGIAYVDESSILIERSAAASYKDKLDDIRRKKEAEKELEDSKRSEKDEGESCSGNSSTQTEKLPDSKEEEVDAEVLPTSFYASKELDPVKAQIEFSDIVNEIVQQFTSRVGVEVKINIDIRASTTDGFDEALQRTVKENCNVLKINTNEFE
ncbi:hypothetical protein [uncultured Psychrobacter sp.]|uniref:ATP-binding protein n=1 Tax=uncultured Psychrobacter sp. TaxID=259303 RepID=UPI00262D4EAE|nr:hypothetical protein [uncultured Psychrobacter sp.]